MRWRLSLGALLLILTPGKSDLLLNVSDEGRQTEQRQLSRPWASMVRVKRCLGRARDIRPRPSVRGHVSCSPNNLQRGCRITLHDGSYRESWPLKKPVSEITYLRLAGLCLRATWEAERHRPSDVAWRPGPNDRRGHDARCGSLVRIR